MNKPVRFLSRHRTARLIAWALAMLTWVTDALIGEGAPHRRRLRQRGRFLFLDRLTRFTCRIAIMRAVELAGMRGRRRVVRNAAPAGFRRRTGRRPNLRACVGARLRRALQRGDLAARIRFLRAALADIDAFSRRYLVRRALRRLTKLRAVVPVAPPAVAVRVLAARAPALADSS